MTADVRERMRQVMKDAVGDRTTCRITVPIDDGESLLPADQIHSITLTLTDLVGGTVINGASETNVKNADRGVLTDGQFVLTLGVDDNVIVVPSRRLEAHLVLIRWTWDGGQKAGWKELELTVTNQASIT